MPRGKRPTELKLYATEPMNFRTLNGEPKPLEVHTGEHIHINQGEKWLVCLSSVLTLNTYLRLAGGIKFLTEQDSDFEIVLPMENISKFPISLSRGVWVATAIKL